MLLYFLDWQAILPIPKKGSALSLSFKKIEDQYLYWKCLPCPASPVIQFIRRASLLPKQN
jgi:hypothetical protein